MENEVGKKNDREGGEGLDNLGAKQPKMREDDEHREATIKDIQRLYAEGNR